MNQEAQNQGNERQEALLNLLKLAASPLRLSLRRHADALAHSHLERAVAHLHEATIAITEPWRARTVDQLFDDMTAIDRHRGELQQSPPPGVILIKPQRP